MKNTLAPFALLFLALVPSAQEDVLEGLKLTPEQVAHWTPAERTELVVIFQDFLEARRAMRAAEERILDFLVAHSTPIDPVDPDRDPDPDPDPGPEGDLAHWDALPFVAPRPPAYTIPTEAECDWTIELGVATSKRGLESISGKPQGLVASCYRASVAAGHELPVTVGIWDATAGRVYVGGLYNPDSDHSLTVRNGAGGWRTDLSLELVGLDDSCEVGLGWTDDWGKAARIAAFNIGLRGPQDSFAIRANDGIGELILDGCYILPHMKDVLDAAGKKIGETPMLHTSGIHIDNWERLVLRRWQYRGVLPTDPGTLVAEHLFYLRSCVGEGTWILENDLRGGDRTGFQIRPDARDSVEPTGVIVIADNVAPGFGWDHGANPPGGGGGIVTVWMNTDSPTYIFGNEFTDARYACLVVSGQPPERNYLNADGFPVGELYVHGNKLENRRALRACAMVSATERVHLWANVFEGPPHGDLSLDSPWNFAINGIKNGSVSVYGQAWLDTLLQLDIRTAIDRSSSSRSQPFPEATLRSYLVP